MFPFFIPVPSFNEGGDESCLGLIICLFLLIIFFWGLLTIVFWIFPIGESLTLLEILKKQLELITSLRIF